ncbi:MAG: hypothetical protein H5T64_04375 [Chloroflexi bacterium]|nr:hypothetical protein [Chloroflexota bacterium]
MPYLLISLSYLAGRAFVVTAFRQSDRLSEVWPGISLGRIALRVWRVFGLNFGQAWEYALRRAAEQGI